jgi:hypothetical protein
VATAERPDLITEYRADPLTVRVDGRAGGRTELGGFGPPVRYAVRADRQAFEDHFLAVLNGQGCPACRANAKRLRHAIAPRWPARGAHRPPQRRP